MAEHFCDQQFDIDAWQVIVNKYRPRATAATTRDQFAFGFKKLKLGKIFGETTAGVVVAGRCFLLGNRDVLYLAVNDVQVDGVARPSQRGCDFLACKSLNQ